MRKRRGGWEWEWDGGRRETERDGEEEQEQEQEQEHWTDGENAETGRVEDWVGSPMGHFRYCSTHQHLSVSYLRLGLSWAMHPRQQLSAPSHPTGPPAQSLRAPTSLQSVGYYRTGLLWADKETATGVLLGC